MRKTRAGLLCLFLPLTATMAQQPTPTREQPVELLRGLGVHRHPIATQNPEAQKFFDQGLNLLYAFNRYEALRSFRRASELDPGALMPYWGMAKAQGPHVNMDLDADLQLPEACEAVRAGQGHRATAPPYEQAYLDAVAAWCPENQGQSYIQAMRELARSYPDDLDAVTFYAESLMIPVRWKWWSQDGQPAEGTEEAIRTLEAVLRRNSEHPGANHFYIHAVEASPEPERAIPSAQRLMGMVPAAGHLLHMPGHIWMVLGDYETVAATSRQGAEADREYMRTTGVTRGAYTTYYVHNLHFVAYARQMQGRRDDAVRAADVLADAALAFLEEMPAMVDPFVPAPLFVRLRFGMWEEILGTPEPDARLRASTAIWHFARASALAVQGRREEAKREQRAFEEARGRLPADWPWLNNRASDVLAAAAEMLDARLAESKDAAVSHWKKAIEIQDQLIYDEPPPWFYPLRESLGGALLRAGRTAEAEAVFREGLAKSPRNGRILFGLIESLQAQGKTRAAELVRPEFETAWKRADVKLRVADL